MRTTTPALANVAGRKAKILAVIFGAMWLVGCAATANDVRDRLGTRYVGLNVDALVAEFGPPATTFKMNNGDTSYLWQLGATTNIDTYKGSGTA